MMRCESTTRNGEQCRRHAVAAVTLDGLFPPKGLYVCGQHRRVWRRSARYVSDKPLWNVNQFTATK